MENDDDKTQTHIVLTKGTMVSHYRIVEKIGAGGMGEVYLAEDTMLKRQIALKFLPAQYAADRDFKARFVREAEASASLNHPNIVTIHEVGEHRERPFFAMELVEGQGLKEFARGGELPIDKVIELVIQICDGLSAAHEKNIIHRDIKPSNIRIDSYGRPKILDFGLAAVQGGDHLTKTGSTLGTVGYMSPEQVKGEPVDHRSDLFSLGVVLYELITGKSPFRRDNDMATGQAIITHTPDPLVKYRANIPDDLQRIVSKLLEKDPAYRYQTAKGVVSDLKQELRNLSTAEASILTQTHIAPRPRKKLLPVLAPIGLAIIVALVLILKPWRFEISPQQEAIAAENRLAIMYFDNLADPADSQKLGEIATNLLITDLTESQYLDVVSSQRLYDILKLLGREGEKKIDPEVATEVATRARAKWMLLGSILQVEPQLIITSQLVDVESGGAVASQRITGEENDNIFAVIDKLTVEVKNDMSLPAAARDEVDQSVADVTTSSPEAYRHYLDGVDYMRKVYRPEALAGFRRALEYDSTFAMAYLRSAVVHFDQLEIESSLRFANQALKYSDKVSRLEKRYIYAIRAAAMGDFTTVENELKAITEEFPDEKTAHYWWAEACRRYLGKYDEAIIHYHRTIELDSLYKLAYNYLAYTYNMVGDYEKSMWAVNQYLALAPNEANPYDTRGDLYSFNGRLDDAIASYKKALDIKPDYWYSIGKLGVVYLYMQQYDEAESCFRRLSASTDKSARSWGRWLLGLVFFGQGKFEKAVEAWNDGIAADMLEQYESTTLTDKIVGKALAYQEMGRLDLAMEEAAVAAPILQRLGPPWDAYAYALRIYLLTENNQVSEAEAEAESLAVFLEGKAPTHVSRKEQFWAIGLIHLARKEPDLAITHFERAVTIRPIDFQSRFFLGRAYLEAGRLGEAVEAMEHAFTRCVSTIGPDIPVKAYYYLGTAYEASGWDSKAVEQYETFLDIWKNADPGIKLLDSARTRLARLKGES